LKYLLLILYGVGLGANCISQYWLMVSAKCFLEYLKCDVIKAKAPS